MTNKHYPYQSAAVAQFMDFVERWPLPKKAHQHLYKLLKWYNQDLSLQWMDVEHAVAGVPSIVCLSVMYSG